MVNRDTLKEIVREVLVEILGGATPTYNIWLTAKEAASVLGVNQFRLESYRRAGILRDGRDFRSSNNHENPSPNGMRFEYNVNACRETLNDLSARASTTKLP